MLGTDLLHRHKVWNHSDPDLLEDLHKPLSFVVKKASLPPSGQATPFLYLSTANVRLLGGWCIGIKQSDTFFKKRG
jgi:hypothetical protein